MTLASDRLRKAMQVRGIESAADLARLAQVNEATTRSAVNGTRGISKRNAERFARALGVDVAWLLYEKGRGLEAVTQENAPTFAAERDKFESLSAAQMITLWRKTKNVSIRNFLSIQGAEVANELADQFAPISYAEMDAAAYNAHYELRGRLLKSADTLINTIDPHAVGPSWAQFLREYWLANPPFIAPQNALKMPPKSEDSSLPESSVDLPNYRSYERQPGQLPVFGTVEGGFEGTEINYEYPVEQIPMPSILAGVFNACGCYVTNTSMEPRYHPGEVVLVHPGRPVKRGDYVVVELIENRGIVKRFLRQTEGFVELEQLNPPQTTRIAREKVVGVYRIVGTYDE